MRKHSVRKWLHAILDLLPVIILPIFAIYSHRHTIDSYEVTVPQNEIVNFNQLVKNGDFLNDNDWYGYNGTISVSNNEITYTVDNSVGYFSNAIRQNNDFDLVGHKVLLHGYLTASEELTCGLGFGSQAIYSVLQPNVSTLVNGIITFMSPYPIEIGIERPLPTVGATLKCSDFYAVDLTQMFGVGNEPTIEQFNTWYPNDYYDYNTGTKQLLKGVSTVTYDNSDIGSQLIYSLYKPINDYFNLNNVFNFGAIYDWFELNMFNGNAPLSIFIVWNIIVYEFIMDIIFLIYSVFMFVIDFACETLDRFTGWAKRGD